MDIDPRLAILAIECWLDGVLPRLAGLQGIEDEPGPPISIDLQRERWAIVCVLEAELQRFASDERRQGEADDGVNAVDASGLHAHGRQPSWRDELKRRLLE